jgi:hypothetical protein
MQMDRTLDNVEANLASIAHYSPAAPSSGTISSILGTDSKTAAMTVSSTAEFTLLFR